MKRIACFMAFALTCGLLLFCGLAAAADEPAKVAGKWELTLAPHGSYGPKTKTLTITQRGAKIKGTLGDDPLWGTVTGNNVCFYVNSKMPGGTPYTLQYSATVEGDSMKGTVGQVLHNAKARFTYYWTAKRAK